MSYRAEGHTGSPHHGGLAGRDSGGPGWWQGTRPAVGEREWVEASRVVGVEDGGPAGRVGPGAGLQGLPTPNADLDTATDPRFRLRDGCSRRPLTPPLATHMRSPATCASRGRPLGCAPAPVAQRYSLLRSRCSYSDPAPSGKSRSKSLNPGTTASILRLRTPRPRGRGPLAKGARTEGGGFKISFQNGPALPTSLVLFKL